MTRKSAFVTCTFFALIATPMHSEPAANGVKQFAEYCLGTFPSIEKMEAVMKREKWDRLEARIRPADDAPYTQSAGNRELFGRDNS
jgi:hypothetical protein